MAANVKISVGNGKSTWGFLYTIFALATAMIGYNINHGSLGWAIVDFFFAPISWCKWLVCHQVNVSMIKYTFDFLLK